MHMYYLPPNLKILREKRNENQEVIATYMGIARNTYTNWERGSSSPDVKQVQQLALYFAVSLDDLIGHDLSKEEVLNMVMEDTATYNTVIKKVDLREISSDLEAMKNTLDRIIRLLKD